MFFGNFNGAFFSTIRGFNSSKAFQQLLESEDMTLEKVLKSDDCLQELRSSNKKLLEQQNLLSLDFKNLSMLISYITDYPRVDDDDDRCNKFPFTTSQLFASDSREFLTQVMGQPALLQQLFSFYTRLPLDLTLAGYVSKAIISLLKCNPELMLAAMQEGNIFPLLLGNLHLSSTSNIIAALFPLEGAFMAQRAFLLQSIINSMSSPKCCNNAMVLIQGLFQKSQIFAWAELVEDLYREMNISYILNNLTSYSPKVAKAAASFVKLIIEKPGLLTTHFFDIIILQLDKISCILNAPTTRLQKSTFQENIEVLGEVRLAVVDMIASLVKLKNYELNSMMAHLSISEIIITLFFKFEWNSMLHTVVYKFVSSVLICENQQLRNDLILCSNLIPKIVEAGINRVRKGKLNPDLCSGLRGHIKKIADCLVEQADIEEIAQNFPLWKRFDEEFLRPQTEIQGRQLGGGQKLNLEQPSDQEEMFFNFQQEEEKKSDEEEEEGEEEEDPLTIEDLADFEIMKGPMGKRKNRYEEEEEDVMFFYNLEYWKVKPLEILEELDQQSPFKYYYY